MSTKFRLATAPARARSLRRQRHACLRRRPEAVRRRRRTTDGRTHAARPGRCHAADADTGRARAGANRQFARAVTLPRGVPCNVAACGGASRAATVARRPCRARPPWCRSGRLGARARRRTLPRSRRLGRCLDRRLHRRRDRRLARRSRWPTPLKREAARPCRGDRVARRAVAGADAADVSPRPARRRARAPRRQRHRRSERRRGDGRLAEAGAGLERKT